LITVSLSAAVLLSANASAHHSFAIYDVYNDPIEFAGVAESFDFTRRWRREEIPEDAIKAGDEMIVIGWPAHDSSPKMVLGSFEIKGAERITIQDSATENSSPPTNKATITRPVCTD